jgi:hypothetical protein
VNVATVRHHALWGVVLLILVLNVPAHLRMGLDSDVALWDLSARTVLDGGTFYRDLFENNLPGMLWLHCAVRTMLGWSDAALRAVDIAVVVVIVWLLTRLLPASSSARAALAAVLLVFYFSQSEWCHCQRDTWMLLPALLALHLRAGNSSSRWRPLVEGLLWGCAFWIKPFVAFPALTCWLVSVPRLGRRQVLSDAAALLTGGVLAGLAGVAWLILSGAWPHFADVMFVGNREYVATDVSGGHPWLFRAGVAVRFFPWMLTHLLAIPLALGQLRDGFRKGVTPQILLAGLYLGWTFQALVLQHLFDYIQVPPLLLALTVVAVAATEAESAVVRRGLVAFLLLCCLLRYPFLAGERLGLWSDCCRASNPIELRDRLTLSHKVDWTDLERIQHFLVEQRVEDEEVTCFSMPTVELYREMGVRPSTRYLFLQNALTIFRTRRPEMRAALAARRQRFVVCDLQWVAMDRFREELDAGTSPWIERVVFRSGRYVVLRLSGAETSAWLEANFGL